MLENIEDLQAWLDATAPEKPELKKPVMVKIFAKPHEKGCNCSACAFLGAHLFLVGIPKYDENKEE